MDPPAATEGSAFNNPTEENSAAADRESTAEEPSNADRNSAAAPILLPNEPLECGVLQVDNSDASISSKTSVFIDASGGASGDTPPDEVEPTVVRILRILGLRQGAKKYLEYNYPTKQSFEEFLQIPSEEVRVESLVDDKVRAIFNQADRDKLILLGRWSEKNRGGGQEVKWEHFSKQTFNAFVRNVDGIIFDEVLKELKISAEAKDKIKNEKILTPANFVEKSKYWYSENFDLNSADIHEIEKFKKWYKYQLDTYLPSDWFVSFRIDSMKERKIEWRKVLKAIGLDDDAIQALEINDICDFETLNYTSKKWRISGPHEWNDISDWDEWQKMGLKQNDARHIINFRHWHNFYVAGKKYKSNWAAEFSSAEYERFVQRYIDPSKPDEFKKPGWWASRGDSLKPSKEKKEYLDMLVAAAEDGIVTEKDRNRLRQHYKGRREKMELIQEINEGVGDSSFQEKRLGEIIEEEAANYSEKKAQDLLFRRKYYQFFFSAILVYVLLWSWLGTTIYFMVFFVNEKESNYAENDYAIFIHNITFGLVTAVVIQELNEETKKTSLYSRFLPIYEEHLDRSKDTRIRARLELRQAWHNLTSTRPRPQHLISFSLLLLWELCKNFVTGMILATTQSYIFYWIVGGAASLGYGVGKNLASTNPLYTTGQTWTGVAVTIGYSYFGLSDKNSPNREDPKDENNQRNPDPNPNYTAQRAIDEGDDKKNGGEVEFTDEKGETKVINTHNGLMNEIDHYKGLLDEAEDEQNFQDAAGYQRCLVQLKQLKPMLPTAKDLESQLKEAQDKMNAAAGRQDYVTAGKFQKDCIKLEKKLKEEEDAAAAGGDTSSS